MVQTSKRRPDNISLLVFDSLTSSETSSETGTVPKFVMYCNCENSVSRAINLRGSARIAVVRIAVICADTWGAMRWVQAQHHDAVWPHCLLNIVSNQYRCMYPKT
jgi:hypothetical protein